MSERERLYDRAFYERQQEGSLRSARRIVPLVAELVRPASVVDVGCGVGGWLSVFAQTPGVTEIQGVDGDHVDRSMLRIPADRFRPMELSAPQDLGRTFDLAVSLEVAEHLPAEAADRFVGCLCALAPVVLFSAAIPFQGGYGHVNEQWPDYWAQKFAARGFAAVDAVRPLVWRDREVQWWYAQNTLLYVRRDRLDSSPALAEAARQTRPGQLSLVHPDRFLIAMQQVRAAAKR